MSTLDAMFAALAATLVPERLEKLRHIFETHRDVHPVNSTEQLVAVYALEVLTAYTALVASGGEPLTAERVAELLLFEDECDGSDDRFAQRVYSALRDYRDAYTALAADLAALRAEVAEWDSVREEVRFLADATEANSVVEAYDRDGVDFKDIDGHMARDRKVVAAVRAVLARTGSPTPARPTPTKEDQ